MYFKITGYTLISYRYRSYISIKLVPIFLDSLELRIQLIYYLFHVFSFKTELYTHLSLFKTVIERCR